jgi:glyoxylase-like metal-dependent hydrolase (beta-lactamase superfamily II)
MPTPLVPLIEPFFHEATSTWTYVVIDPATHEAAIIDPVWDFDPQSGQLSHTFADQLIAYLGAQNAQLSWILETHAHADHLSSAHYLQTRLGGQIAIGEHITAVQRVFRDVYNLGADFPVDGRPFDRLLKDSEVFYVGQLPFTVLWVPGHTSADVAYQVGHHVFVGDTLFMPDVGTARTDFPGGDASTLYRSIQRLLALPSETVLCLCHDYPPEGRAPIWSSTVETHHLHNIHVHEGVTEAEFVARRVERDKGLRAPVLLIPSIQVNIRAGRLPEPENNGRVYLKIPLRLSR